MRMCSVLMYSSCMESANCWALPMTRTISVDMDNWLEPLTDGIFFSNCSKRAWSIGTSV